jgi:hypothetical protein
MGHMEHATTIPIGLTHAEIFVIWSIIQAWISRCVFIFFDRSFCPFWDTNGGVLGSQTAFGKNSHMLQGMVRKWDEKQAPVGPLFSGCVKYFPKKSFSPMHPWWSPKKGKNFGQKKSTHADIFKTSISGNMWKSRSVLTFSDLFLFHIWCTYGAVSGQKTPFGSDSHRLRKQRLGLQLGLAFSTLKRVLIGKCPMAQMEPFWMRSWVYQAFSTNLDF